MLDLTTVIEAESRRFADAIAQAAPDAAVPTCPGWTADDLAWHLTEVHGFWARVLTSGAQTDEESEAVEAAGPSRPGSRAETMALFERATGQLLEALAGAEDATPAWFWLATDRTVGATRRMQAHEATMHRVDAEAAAGLDSAPVDPRLAADGIEHAFDVMWAWWGTQPGFSFAPGATRVELVAEDTGHGWLVEPGRWQGVGQSGKAYDVPGARRVLAGTPAARVTGSAEALMRWLWGRGDEPAASGDAGALDPLRAARDQGMQ